MNYRHTTIRIDLVGKHGIATRLGVKYERVRKWEQRGQLPKPYIDDADGRRWLWDVVARHIERQGFLGAD